MSSPRYVSPPQLELRALPRLLHPHTRAALHYYAAQTSRMMQLMAPVSVVTSSIDIGRLGEYIDKKMSYFLAFVTSYDVKSMLCSLRGPDEKGLRWTIQPDMCVNV